MQAKPLRPTGVTVLGILVVLIGVFGILGGAVLLTSTDLALVSLSAFAVVIGILYLACGIGLFRGNRWAWILGLIVSALALIRNAISAAEGMIVTAIPGAIVALIIAYYLTTPTVKGYFQKGNLKA